MSRSVQLRCPACSEVFGQLPRGRLAVGCPFLECPKCRAYVGMPATNEWGLLGPGEKAYWVADRIAPFLVAGVVPALAYWALVFSEGSGDRRTLIALFCAGPIFVAFLPISSALRLVRRSRARMADPMYRARLIAFSRSASSTERT